MNHNPFAAFVNPQFVSSTAQVGTGQVFIRLGMASSIDPFALPPRKPAFAEMSWEVPGVGTFKRGEVMGILGISDKFFTKMKNKHKIKGKLPTGWRECLWLCVHKKQFSEYCISVPKDFSRKLPRLTDPYRLRDAELELVLGLSKFRIQHARDVGSSRAYSLVFAWMEKFPAFTLEQLILCRRHHGQLLAHEEKMLTWLEQRLSA